MTARWLAAVVVGTSVAFGLFLGMSRLVAFGAVRLEDARDRDPIEFVRLRREPQEVAKKKLKPRRPPPPPAAPPAPTPNAPPPGGASGLAIDVGMPDANPNLKLTGGLSAGTVRDREAVPVVRVQPIYPRRMADQGIEGYVVMRFTITPSGGVSDIEVVESKPAGMFDRNAERALARWRYDPQLVDGRPVPRPGQLVRLDFQMDRGQP
ncbi:MAG: TonB family protein [Myxococcota bacterium]